MESEQEPDYIPFHPSAQKPCFSSQKIKEFLAINYENEEDQDYIDECSFNFTSFEHQKEVSLGKYNPDRQYCVVIPGLNLKAMCQNKQCKAYMKKTWIRKGYGKFDIGEERFKNKCPCCATPVKASTIKSIGFSKCQITIQGMRLDGDEQEQYNQTFSEKNGKLIYFSDFDEHMSNWGYLKINAKKI